MGTLCYELFAQRFKAKGEAISMSTADDLNPYFLKQFIFVTYSAMIKVFVSEKEIDVVKEVVR